MGRLVTGDKAHNPSILKCNILLPELSLVDHFICVHLPPTSCFLLMNFFVSFEVLVALNIRMTVSRDVRSTLKIQAAGSSIVLIPCTRVHDTSKNAIILVFF